jgi:diamine N-acetyltransferase
VQECIDDDDGSAWLGGLLVDAAFQGRGYGRAAVRAALAMLATEKGRAEFALSYQPANVVARRLYASLGFVETGEVDGDEVVARLSSA